MLRPLTVTGQHGEALQLVIGITLLPWPSQLLPKAVDINAYLPLELVSFPQRLASILIGSLDLN